MKPMSRKFVCDVCGRKRSHGAKKIDHSKCSKIRQAKHNKGGA